MTTTKPTDDEIDNYIARLAVSQDTSTDAGKLLEMARDAASNEATRGSIPILHRAAWELAAWELAQA